MTRTKLLSSFIEDLKKQTNEICDNFSMFENGTRMIILIQRTKDGGHNKEHKRIKSHFIYKNKEQFRDAMFNALLLKQIFSEENLRVYLSINSRNIKKAIHHMEECLLEDKYSNDKEKSYNLNHKIFTDQRTFLMQPSCRNEKMFLLDIDEVDGKDIFGEVLQKIEKNNIIELFRTKTKNGWHVITEPFNPILLGEYANIINKDGLILLSY